MTLAGPISAPAQVRDGPILGIDVGGTKVAALVVDGADRVLAHEVVSTSLHTLADGLVALGRRAVAAAGLPATGLAAVGIGLPGRIDAATGAVRLAVNLDAGDQPLRALLAHELGAPCFVDHDVRAAARYLASLEPGCRAVGFLSVGTGVAAGVVIDGVPLTGASGLAGEVGHLVADPGGPRCACGLTGCLEALVSGPAIARRAREIAGTTPPRTTAFTGATDAAAVYAAAGSGDAAARALADDVGATLARAIRGLVLAFGLDRVIVGGGVSRAGAPFFDPILRALDDERARSVLVREAIGPDVVRLLPPEVDAGARGAIAVARAGIRAGDPPDGAPERKEGG